LRFAVTSLPSAGYHIELSYNWEVR
ncbi:MAG: hypothetical protein QOG02_1241, partial [Gaiellales bacterium]|nr:hypothetical protein [Gaiellales bacterium]